MPRGLRALNQANQNSTRNPHQHQKGNLSICQEKSLSERPETLHKGGPARREGEREGSPGSLEEEEEEARRHSGGGTAVGRGRVSWPWRVVPGFQSQLCYFRALCLTPGQSRASLRLSFLICKMGITVDSSHRCV